MKLLLHLQICGVLFKYFTIGSTSKVFNPPINAHRCFRLFSRSRQVHLSWVVKADTEKVFVRRGAADGDCLFIPACIQYVIKFIVLLCFEWYVLLSYLEKAVVVI